MKKSFMTRILATGLSLAMAFSMAAATNVTTASAASKPAMITSAGASAKSLSLKVGEVTKIKVNAATKANYKVSAVKASSKRVRAAVVGSTVVAIRGLKATVEGKPSTVKISFKSRKTNKTSKFTYSSRVTVIEDKLTVTGVSAADATTLTVTGTKLGDLTAADIKVTPTVAVASYTAAADGKTATVKLAAGLQSATEYTVAVNGSEFKVSYTAGEITSVAVVETTYDNDTPGQVLAITVNGGSPITVHDLLSDGYFVEFSVTTKGAVENNFFDVTPASNKSQTGVLKNSIAEGDYGVQVVLTKGSSIITSPVATVKIANLDATATSFENFVLAGNNAAGSIAGVKLKGKTLVAGEVAVLTEAAIMTADGKVKLPTSVLSKVGVTSDNLNVIQINKNGTTNEIKAIAPGTATVTFTYGSVKTTATYTVVNSVRYPAKAVAETTTLRAVAGGNLVSTKVIVTDQYGECFKGLVFTNDRNGAKIYTVHSNIATAAATATPTDANGKAEVKVQGRVKGNTSLTFAYIDNNLNKASNTSATIVVTDPSSAVTAKNKLVASATATTSNDLTIDTYDKTGDTNVIVKLQTYTIDDALVSGSAVIPKDWYFQYDAAVITLASVSTTNWTQQPAATVGYNWAKCTVTNDAIQFAAKGKGTTAVKLFNAAGIEQASATITVNDSTPYLTGVTFNTACPTSLTYDGEKLDYTKVFNIGDRSSDPVITGITVAQPYAQLRINRTADTDKGCWIYIDADSDGVYNATYDTIIGKITIEGWTPTTNVLDTYELGTTGTPGQKTITYKVTDKFTTKVIGAKAITVAK